MSRYECQRCHEVCFTTDPPHLCVDVRKRHERREKAVGIVVDILVNAGTDDGDPVEAYREVAEEIVIALAGRDLGL